MNNIKMRIDNLDSCINQIYENRNTILDHLKKAQQLLVDMNISLIPCKNCVAQIYEELNKNTEEFPKVTSDYPQERRKRRKVARKSVPPRKITPIIEKILDTLTEEEKMLFKFRFGFGCSQKSYREIEKIMPAYTRTCSQTVFRNSMFKVKYSLPELIKQLPEQYSDIRQYVEDWAESAY